MIDTLVVGFQTGHLCWNPHMQRVLRTKHWQLERRFAIPPDVLPRTLGGLVASCTGDMHRACWHSWQLGSVAHKLMMFIKPSGSGYGKR